MNTYSNSNNTWHTQYWDKRNKDVHCEEMCASYVDDNWFSKMPDKLTYERVRVVDDETKARQIQGEDVVVTINTSGKTMVIDEKAKLYGMVNRVLNYPSFEVICKNQYGTDFFESWFVSDSQTNTHYAMISIGADHEVPKGDEYTLDESQITCMVYGLIDRAKLHDWVESKTGKTIDEITKDAWELLDEYHQHPYKYTKFAPVHTYCKDELGNYIYLKLSKDKKEQPVNLIVRRDYLRKHKLITEVYIDKDKVTKYIPPATFDRKGDKLEAID